MTASLTDIDWPRLGIVLPEYTDKSSDWLVEFAVDADRVGIGSIWGGETWGYDTFSLLARVAERTDCPLGTSVANVFARSPTSIAAGALALDDATDGRFFLGLGVSTPNIVSGFHGEAFDRPLRRLREVIEIVDLALAGEEIEYDGDIFQLTGFTMNHATDDVSVPVLNGALHPTNVALSIDHADGILPHMMPLSGIEPAIEAGRERANSEREIHVSPVIPTAVSEDPVAAQEAVADHIARYVGSTTVYNDVVASHGFADEAVKIRNAWRDGDRASAVKSVSPALRNAVGIAGSPTTAREHLRDIHDREIIDATLHSFPEGASGDMFMTTVETFAGAFD